MARSRPGWTCARGLVRRPRPGMRSPGLQPGELLLTKCCLLERDIQVDGTTAVVPVGGEPRRGTGRPAGPVRRLAGRLPARRDVPPACESPGHELCAPRRLGRLRPPVDHPGGVRAVLRRGQDPGLAAASWPPWPRRRPRPAWSRPPQRRRSARTPTSPGWTWAWSPSRPGPAGHSTIGLIRALRQVLPAARAGVGVLRRDRAGPVRHLVRARSSGPSATSPSGT